MLDLPGTSAEPMVPGGWCLIGRLIQQKLEERKRHLGWRMGDGWPWVPSIEMSVYHCGSVIGLVLDLVSMSGSHTLVEMLWALKMKKSSR